jgi:SulP family sulfate permease
MSSPCRPNAHIRAAPHHIAPTLGTFRDSILATPTNPEVVRHSSQYDQTGSLYGAVDTRGDEEATNAPSMPHLPLTHHNEHISFDATNSNASNTQTHHRKPLLHKQLHAVQSTATQIPAIALITLFHLMVSIPFGVSYFPVRWKSATSIQSVDTDDKTTTDYDFNLDGSFPIPGKEALGIRMFLFSTIIGQLAMTFASNFNNCIALQMVENVPFTISLSYIVIEEQGYGKEALSTLFFLFGLASMIVGVVFYLLGRYEMGRILYFFPAHVLVGCIGGIGVFIAKTGLEVTANRSFSLDVSGISSFVDRFHLLLVVFGFEVGLRLLNYFTRDSSGKAKYPLLSPVYFCLITPVFYLGIWLAGKSTESALEEGYFFPPLTDEGTSIMSGLMNDSVWDIFHMVNLSSVSFTAVFQSIPTLLALVLFSLIHVPINIPAFAVSTDVDVDMNIELMAHGWSNSIVGVFGGLQNYMAYTQSIIYYKSGGKGKTSSLAVAIVTTILFFIGPAIASYMPRCMAGTLLLHCGVDLFLEGVRDSYGHYDYLEYIGIWTITIVMTLSGMEAALLAGVISALLTYAIQSVTYPKPIRGSMTAATLRSSAWNRCPEAFEILDSKENGRVKIFVIQLQGHLFFGNISIFSDGVKKRIQTFPRDERPIIVIIDFTLVLGIDSSAAQAIIKLRDYLSKHFGIAISIFVPGNELGFPCEYPMHEALVCQNDQLPETFNPIEKESFANLTYGEKMAAKIGLNGSHVCGDLDQALVYAEDALVALVSPTLLDDNIRRSFLERGKKHISSFDEEYQYALGYLVRMCPSEDPQLVEKFMSYLTREVYQDGDILWRQGSESDSAKLLVSGELISRLENEAGTSETISLGSVIGESGLVNEANRNSTVYVLEDNTVLYSLSKEAWISLKEKEPKCANLLYGIVIRYLTLRVQHVSNRIFETRCLPI